ncbi:Phosphatidylglycerophosphate synthase [Archaeoglobus sulfaticallidus PM70-1]|uniref:Archaetidylinositol phosphate synthase n=1 Tax=Archaeoglobus sulfaticallidus PM70-1 TaxID=387631 RepID=N0BHR3_9EURY|nr:archaetidylinositol phosphate synthase [Archaeoglobus sulfaticallidus]AGK61852.1 Phosphatidylglycerophosphate synthase [Archaeoglobus sulfaticallidus PM70-1]
MLSSLKLHITKVLAPLTSTIYRLGVKPNHLTFIGLLVGFSSAYLISIGELILGGIFIILSGLFDMLDGALARNQTLKTDFGGYIDSVSDRYVDVAIFIALGIYGVNWVYVAFAMSGALLVSYTRARAENIIEKCDVGIAERGERLIIIFAGLILGNPELAVLIVALLSHFTAIQRVYHTYKETVKRG